MPIVLDAVLNLEVPDKFNGTAEYNCLKKLQAGVEYLHSELRKEELAHESRNNASLPPGAISLGGLSFNRPELDGLPAHIDCLFDWYIVTVSKMVSVVAHAYKGYNSQFDEKAYREDNRFAAVLKYRNKIAAHFAFTDPRSTDNTADLEYSKGRIIQYQGVVDMLAPGGPKSLLRLTAGGYSHIATDGSQAQHYPVFKPTIFHEQTIVPMNILTSR